MKIHYKNTRILDIIFWISFIFFTNPGGVLIALGENSGDGGINVADILYGIMLICFIIVFRKNAENDDKSFKKTIKFLVIVLLYYYLIFLLIVPILNGNQEYSPIMALIKGRYSFINISLVLLVYEFYKRSYLLFYKIFLFSSLVIIILFVSSVITKIEFLPVEMVNRRFTETRRLIMANYALLPILIPMGIVVIIFKFNIKFKKYIIIGALLVFLLWLLSIFRRHLLGTFVYIFIAFGVNGYVMKKPFISIGKFSRIMFYSLILFFAVKAVFPEYIESTVEAMEETAHIIQYGETTTGKKDVRLGSGKEFLQKIIQKNYIFGTGFDNRWRTLEGNLAGYEASDYPFLAAIAMFGVFGLIFFIPVYFVLARAIVFDLKFLRGTELNLNSFETYAVVFFIVYFIFDFMQYMNWFLPMSVGTQISDVKFFAFLGMYLASRNIFYKKILSRELKSIN